MTTLQDYEVIENDFPSLNKVVKIGNKYIPYGCWSNPDWCEYAKLADIQKE